MTELLFNLLYCVLYGVVVWAAQAIVRVVVPYIRTKLESSQYEWAASIITNAVRAYEQMYSKPGMGDHKYRLVVSQVTKELEKLGIHLTDGQISTLIEAAVQTMNAEKFETSEICNIELPVPEDDDEQL